MHKYTLEMRKILNLQIVDNSNFEEQLGAYLSLVSHWNTISKIVSKGIVDNLLTELVYPSLAPLQKLPVPSGAFLLDVGSGAGFPAIPLKLARPDLNLTLLEPVRNKCLFLKRVVDELSLERVDVVQDRVETFSQQPEQVGRYDLVTTRGTGHVATLFSSIKHLLKSPGQVWFYKGASAAIVFQQLQDLTDLHRQLLPLPQNLHLIVVQF